MEWFPGSLVAAILALALALLSVGLVSAASPDGSSPQATIPLNGTVTGTLAPGKTVWYSYYHDANFNDAITLKSNPALSMSQYLNGDNTGYTGGVYFNVEWQGQQWDANFPGGMFQQDVPDFYRVGQSTQSALADGTSLPDGTQYWQQGKSPHSMSFDLEVVNQSPSPIKYALTLTQSNGAISADDNALPAP